MIKSYEELAAENKALLAENEKLHKSLDEFQELLQAISRGEIDALVLSGLKGEQVYTLEGADRAYRIFLEAMNDGAVTITSDGTILYCNRRFADMVKSSLEKVAGSSFYRFIPQIDQAMFGVLQQRLGRGELTLQAEDKSIMPVYVSINSLQLSESQEALCVIITDLTEQKQKEEIVAAEKLACSIIDQATEAIVVCDMEGKIIRFSNAVLRILGSDPSFQSFEDLFNLHHPLGEKLSPASAALQGEVLLQVEASFKRSGGKQFHLLLNAGPLKNADGKIIGCVITLTDITERKQVEEALRKSEELFRVTIQNSPVNVSAQDLNLRYIWQYNPQLGYSVNDVIGKTDPELLPTETAKRVMELKRRAISSNSRVREEVSTIYGNKTLHYDFTVEPLRDPQGKIAGVTNIVVDITGRKQAEEALRESEERFRKVFEHAAFGMALGDMEGRVLESNPALERILGYSKEELHYKLFAEFTHPDDLMIERPQIEKLIAGQIDHYEIEKRYIRKDGKIIWIRLVGSLTRDINGKPSVGIALIKDITELKKAEDSIQQLLKSVQQEKDKLLTLINNIPDEVWYFSADGNVELVNPPVVRAFGSGLINLKEAAKLNDNSEVYLPNGKPRQAADSPPLRALKGETVVGQEEVVRVPSSGELRTRQANASPVKDAEGNVVGAVAIVRDITERKKAEEALQASNQRINEILESIQDDFYVLDRDWRFVYASKNFTSRIGKDPEDFVGKNIWEMFPNHLGTILEENYRAAMEKREIREFELHGQYTDHWYRMKVYPSEEGITLLGTEITERKRSEEALRIRENDLARAQATAHLGSWRWDLANDVVTWSDELYRIFSVDPKTFIPSNAAAHEMIHPDDRDLHTKLAAIALTGRVVEPFESRIIRPNGEERVILSSGFDVEFNAIGKPAVLFGTILDITDRKRQEKALQDSEERFRMALRNAPVSVSAQDCDLRFIWAYNQRTARPEEIIGKFDADIFTPEEAEHLSAIKRRVLDENIEVREQMWLDRPGGRMFLDICFEPIHDETGRTIGVGTATVDLTPIKLTEEALSKSRDKLELRVKERTEELSQANKKLEAVNINLIDEIKGHTKAKAELQTAKEEQESLNEKLRVEIDEHKQTEKHLIVAKEAAEAATKAKAEFLASMSHEIRTPMNSVIGFTELLLDESEPLNPDQRDNLEHIRINGHALLTIINDILDFSKMESGKLVLEDQSFNLCSCVEESLDLVSIKASEKSLNLSYTIDKEVPDIIIGDPGRLRQVLGNLLSNAVKFTDKGEVKISVSSQQIDGIDKCNEVHFAVQDTGIGISQDGMNQLFHPFTQMEPSTTRLYGGTGLGLAISKKLVEMMNGKIWAESQEGVGSTFHFTIKAPSEQVEPKPTVVSPQLIGKSVLIVVDNRTNRRILTKQVYDWGMVPVPAGSGREALSWIQRGDDFDIAILDMDLQDMEGLGLEEEIRKHNKTLPLVLLTSLGKRVPPNHAYLTKPIKPAQLYKVLTEILIVTNILSDQPLSGQTLSSQSLSSQPDNGLVKASGDDQLIQNKHLRILLAEDNVSSQMVAKMMLKKLGYRADVVANGIEALQSLERQHYDVVLMDVKMPGMDGLEATCIIRQRWPNNGPKIIAITAYALEGDKEKCLEAGMNDYIAKPVQIEDLKRALKEISRL